MTSDDAIIAKALQILSRRTLQPETSASSPEAVRQYLTLKLGQQEREIFGVMWLNVANRVIAYEEVFFGTLTHASVYPREVVKSALKHNAASAICFHNHPSGSPKPSRADEQLTQVLKDTLALVDVRLLDHIIVAGSQTMSFAERALI
ncbi:RadC family protein [Glaciimonas sp. GG7]